MEPPDPSKWRLKWNTRDLAHIDALARTYRAREPIDDKTAWNAAEYEYSKTIGPKFRRIRHA